MNQPSSTNESGGSYGALRLIGILKLAEGVLIFVVACGILRLVHHDVAEMVAHAAAAVKIDPHNEYLHRLVAGLGVLDDQRLKELSAGSFFYSAVRLVEGIGLLRRKRWAEYLVLILTGALLPVELHELVHRPSWIKGGVLAANLAIVAYLIVNLRHGRTQRFMPPG